MDKWLIPSGILLLIIMIFVPLIALILGIIAGIFIGTLLYFNYSLPPPYLSVNQDLEIVINWLSRKTDETVIALKIDSEILLLKPDKRIDNEFTGRNAVNSLIIKKTLGITPGEKIFYLIEKISELPFSVNNESFDVMHIQIPQKISRIFRWSRDQWFQVPIPSLPSVSCGVGHNNSYFNLKVAVIGDMQPKSTIPPFLQFYITKKIKKQKPDLFLYLGDHTNEGIDWRAWNQFYHVIGVVASHTPILGIPGNHDTALGRKGGTRRIEEAYKTYVNYPNQKRYFLEIYGIQLFAFDFLSGFQLDSDNYKLLQDNQSKLDKSKWILTIWHSSPYNSVRENQDVKDIRQHYIPILDGAGCRLWLGGHEHAYQKFKKSETYYITTAASSGFHHHRDSDEGLEKIIMKFHYVILEIQQNEMRLKAISIRNELIDEILFRK